MADLSTYIPVGESRREETLVNNRTLRLTVVTDYEPMTIQTVRPATDAEMNAWFAPASSEGETP